MRQPPYRSANSHSRGRREVPDRRHVSPRLADLLTSQGHDAVAVREVGLSEAPDSQIVDYAVDTDRIVVSHDTDFGALLASVSGPSRRSSCFDHPIRLPQTSRPTSSPPISKRSPTNWVKVQSLSSPGAGSAYVVFPFSRPSNLEVIRDAFSDLPAPVDNAYLRVLAARFGGVAPAR